MSSNPKDYVSPESNLLKSGGYQPRSGAALVDRDAEEIKAIMAEIKERGTWWAADEIWRLRNRIRASAARGLTKDQG